jgi:hypothetical protein
MKNMLLAICCLCSVLTIVACKGQSGPNTANPGDGGTGGGSVTPAQSNLDTIIDSAKMPAHVAVDSVKKK